jgi:hypothetical protein
MRQLNSCGEAVKQIKTAQQPFTIFFASCHLKSRC